MSVDLPARNTAAGSRRGLMIGIVAAVVVLAAMAYDMKVVRLGAGGGGMPQAFSPGKFGMEQFPRIQEFIVKRAVDGPALATAVLADKAAAIKQYGVESSTGAILPVKLSGVAGENKSGVYDLKVEGVPDEIHVRVQTGPAINGTDLRDAPGDIKFGQFKNQIEYQDAGSGINRAMKKAVLDAIDTTNLTGKTLEVVGAFRLINPKNWIITPVKVAVK
jgi:predicted lipoprotein